MARSLIGALVRGGMPASRIAVAEPNEPLRRQLADDFGVSVFGGAVEAVQAADIIMLAVKPQVMRTVCVDIAGAVAARRPLIISIAAGLRIAQIDRWLGGGFPIVRCMPNTPALIGAGATGMIANAAVDAPARDQAQAILAASGLAVWIEREELMDTVTGVSGSGPAYFFLLIEALEDAGVAGLHIEDQVNPSPRAWRAKPRACWPFRPVWARRAWRVRMARRRDTCANG